MNSIQETQTPNTTPTYFIFDRRILGIMDTAKRVIEALAVGTIVSQHHWTAIALVLLRVTLSSIVTFSTIKNPIQK